MNRFQFVLQHVDQPGQMPLAQLTEQIDGAVKTVVVEGDDPEADPAVMILASWLAFRMHADIGTVGGYQQLLDICKNRLSEYDTFQ